MAHVEEIVVNAVNLALGLVILLQVLDLGRILHRERPETLTARLFFAQKQFVRLTSLLLVGLVIFGVSNAFELYGDIMHIDWAVNEAIEAVALLFVLLALLRFRQVLLPPNAREVVPVPQEGP